MNMTETIALLAGVAEFQPQATDEVAAQMWAQTLTSEMTVEFAMAHAAHHFALSKEPLKPADFNSAWSEKISSDYWREQQQRAAIEADERIQDAGFHYASDPATGFLPQQRTNRATPEVVALFFAAWHDSKGAGSIHPDGRPFALQDYFDGVLPLMQDAARNARQDPVESHCGTKACPCMHSSGCYRGWMDDEKASSQTRPCPVCRPSLTQTLDQIPPPGSRNLADQARLLNRARDDRQQGAS